jgi:aspartate carbamoyltransferase regulatory subunit
MTKTKTMNNKRTELKVSAIRNGTVIDHIPADSAFQVVKLLNLDESSRQIYFGTNLDSKKYGKKGIIKISNKYFEDEEISKIALVAPSATLIEIKDYEVTKKEKVHLPETVEKIVKCFNPKCVTNIQHIPTRFKVIEDHNGKMKLACHFCEKTMGEQHIEFL